MVAVVSHHLVTALLRRQAEPWQPVAGLPTRAAGKLHHMASSWEASGLGDARRCDWARVLLIDDDRRNIDRAVEWGGRAAWFRPELADAAEQQLLTDLQEVLLGPPPPPSPSSAMCFVTPPQPQRGVPGVPLQVRN